MNYNSSRSVARAWAMDNPVGDPFSGPAYASKPWAASQPGHRDFIADAVQGVGDAVSSVVKGVKDSGLGPLIGGALAVAFAPVTGGASLAMWAALGSAAGTVLTGGNLGDALKNGALAYAGGQIFGAAGNAGTGIDASTGQFAGETSASGPAGASAAPSTTDGLIASQMGVSTSPEQMLMASAPQSSATMTDVSPGMLNAAADNAVGAGAGTPAMPGAVADSGAISGMSSNLVAPPSPRGGLIGGVMDWAEANPRLSGPLAAAGVQVAGGALAGMGNQANQRQMLETRIQADRDLQTQKQQQAIELEEWKRKFAQSGSYFDALIPFKRATNTALARPGGAPVFNAGGGLIANQMNAA